VPKLPENTKFPALADISPPAQRFTSRPSTPRSNAIRSTSATTPGCSATLQAPASPTKGPKSQIFINFSQPTTFSDIQITSWGTQDIFSVNKTNSTFQFALLRHHFWILHVPRCQHLFFSFSGHVATTPRGGTYSTVHDHTFTGGCWRNSIGLLTSDQSSTHFNRYIEYRPERSSLRGNIFHLFPLQPSFSQVSLLA